MSSVLAQLVSSNSPRYGHQSERMAPMLVCPAAKRRPSASPLHLLTLLIILFAAMTAHAQVCMNINLNNPVDEYILSRLLGSRTHVHYYFHRSERRVLHHLKPYKHSALYFQLKPVRGGAPTSFCRGPRMRHTPRPRT